MQDRIILGDTLDYGTTVADYLASAGWTLKYRLVPRTTGTAILLTAAANGDAYRVQVTSATTATWAAGEYSWASWVEKAGEVYSLSQGTCKLLADPRTAAAPMDSRTDAQTALDNVTATLQGRANSAVLEYEIAGRRLKYMTPAELIELRSHLQAQVMHEERADASAKGYPDKRKTYVRMANA